MNTSIISLLLSFSLLSATPVGRAGKWVSPTAFHTYVEIVGKKQGQLKPQESKGKRDGTWIEVMSYNFNGDRAGDPTVGGHGNGTQKYNPLNITRKPDDISPKLMAAFKDKEPLEIKIVKVTDDEKQTVMSTIILHNATIISMLNSGQSETSTFVYKGYDQQQPVP
jgi:type VI secretion system Hcp family effector